MNILEVKDLTKLYGDFAAVDGIDFAVKRGEIFGFLGPNGAGKTTTINMLTGLAKITEGTIFLAGIDCVLQMKKAQELMGIVPDESNLYPEMNGWENLDFCGALYGMDKRARNKKAWELLEQVGLKEAARKPFKAYSRGMKRRLTIAAGIIHNPSILFLDEPTTGIDVESARNIRKLLLDLNKKGTTIFLTTHYIEEAERLCNRIAFIVNGKIVKTDYTSKLLEEAQKKQTVQFTVGGGVHKLQSVLGQAFPKYKSEVVDEQTIRISSSETVDLIPIIDVFRNNSVTLYEAKVVRPSLEEVFVKITGIEAKKMKNEGGKK
ncbi:MAG TPA: ABC transporter ATP-binding protein [Clostridia bacterium]|nr:ABC transporter ATP-binding protein [Clostridia bacterium]